LDSETINIVNKLNKELGIKVEFNIKKTPIADKKINKESILYENNSNTKTKNYLFFIIIGILLFLGFFYLIVTNNK
jgi:hypothetical protein